MLSFIKMRCRERKRDAERSAGGRERERERERNKTTLRSSKRSHSFQALSFSARQRRYKEAFSETFAKKRCQHFFGNKSLCPKAKTASI